MLPTLGDRQVAEIEGPAIRDVLSPIWLAKPETARRVRQRIGAVLDWAYLRAEFWARNAINRNWFTTALPRRDRIANVLTGINRRTAS